MTFCRWLQELNAFLMLGSSLTSKTISFLLVASPQQKEKPQM
jgi:hypothetical protein